MVYAFRVPIKNSVTTEPYKRVGVPLFFIDTETTEVTELSFITSNRFTNLDAIEVYLPVVVVLTLNTLCELCGLCVYISCPLNAA